MQLLFPKPTTTMNEQIVVNGQLMHRYQFNPYLMPQQQQQHWTPHPQRTTVGKFRRRRSNHSLVATMDPAAVARRNERERNRVKQVNDGFDELKQRVPFLPDKKKLSKVEILRYAILYITDLKNILEEHDVSTTGKPRKDSEGNSCFSEEEDLLAADLLVFSSDQLSDSLLC